MCENQMHQFENISVEYCMDISKTNSIQTELLCQGGYVSVRTDKDTPVTAYSAADINTTRRIPYPPPITVLPFVLARLVYKFKQTLCHCCQLWPYIGMGLLYMPCHWDCNAMDNTAKISPPLPSTCAHNAIPSGIIRHMIWSHQFNVAIDNPSLILSISFVTSSCCHWNYVYPTQQTCKATAVGAFLPCTKFQTGSMLPEFSGMLVIARANQYPRIAPSSLFWSMILNNCCSSHGRCPFSMPKHLPGHWFTHT